jgi:hypothetical protein
VPCSKPTVATRPEHKSRSIQDSTVIRNASGAMTSNLKPSFTSVSNNDLFTQRDAEFREVFHNCYVTGSSIGPLVWTACNVIFGLIFSLILLLFVAFFVIAECYIIFGVDLYPAFDIKSAIADVDRSLGGVIGELIIFIIGVVVLATFALHNLNVVRLRLVDRLYLLSGGRLESVEGRAIFEPDSESGYNGIEIGELYFGFDHCWLDVRVEDLEKLDRAGGTMRIWYIHTRLRSWIQPSTGKTIKYNCTLVRAEWRAREEGGTRNEERGMMNDE